MAGEGDTERLVVLLEARLTDFERNMRKASGISESEWRRIQKHGTDGAGMISKALAMTSTQVGEFSKAASGMALRWAAAAASIIGVVEAFRGIRQSVKTLDDMGDAAERLGVSTDFLQTFAFQLGQFGGEAKDAEGALDRFSNKIGEAAKGSGDLAELFAANGVALRDQNGELRSSEELLQDFARLVANAGSAQAKINLTTEAFGRGAGPKMVGLMQEIDRVGFKTLISDAEKAGAIIANGDIAKAGELEKDFQRFEVAASNALKTIAVEAGPMALEVMKGIAEAAREIVGIWGEWKAGDVAIKYRNQGAKSLSLQELQLWKKNLKPQQMWVENSDSGENITVPGTLPDDAQARLDALLKAQGDNAPKATGPKTIIPKAKKSSAAEETTDYERAKDAIEKHTEALEIDAATVGMSEEAAARYKAEQQLINAALRDGKPITDAQRAAIASTADAYALATRRLDEMQKRLEAVKQASEGLSNAFSTAVEDMIFEGKSFDDVMKSLAKTIGKDLVHSLLTGQGAFAGLLGTTGKNGQAGGLLGSLFSSILTVGAAEGGYIRGPGTSTSDSIPARLSNGEYVFSARAVSAIGAGNLDALHSAAKGYAGGGYVGPAPVAGRDGAAPPVIHQTFSYTIDARGADAAAVARIEDGLKQRDRQFGPGVSAVIHRQRTRGTRT